MPTMTTVLFICQSAMGRFMAGTLSGNVKAK